MRLSSLKFATLLACSPSAFLLIVSSPARGDDPAAGRFRASAVVVNDDQPAELAPSDIDRLIEELGNDRYIQRRRAQQQLRQIGLDAFDRLHLATEHVDPEIAAAAKYLLGEIAVPWTTSEDPPDVVTVMSRFDTLRDELRLQRIHLLARLPRQQRLPALCRIVRFDPSEHVSKAAAIAVLAPRERPHRPSSNEESILIDQLGTCARTGAAWLRLFLEQSHDPAATVPDWQRFVDAESNLLGGESRRSSSDLQITQGDDLPFGSPSMISVSPYAKTSSDVVVNLTWHLLGLYQELQRTEQAIATMARILEFEPDQFETTAVELIDWFTQIEAWDALEQLLTKYDDRLATTRRAQYVAAMARIQQGRDDLAQLLANRAWEVDPRSPLERIEVASKLLVNRQQWDWAKKEYQRAIESEPPASKWSLLARLWLAAMLQDLEEYSEAAQLLEFVEQRIDTDRGFRTSYDSSRKELTKIYGQELLLSPQNLSARRHYFQACHAHQQHAWQQQREHLLKSIELESTDADVLIAMYRAPGGDEDWQQDVRQRILDLSRQFQLEIDENPEDPTGYNQWAWLISNTEGDFQKAVRYSLRSLDLAGSRQRPASFLDTLGRCYYAAGDLENALKYQREAVDRDPSMMVMQRQLDLFERVLAERNDAQE